MLLRTYSLQLNCLHALARCLPALAAYRPGLAFRPSCPLALAGCLPGQNSRSGCLPPCLPARRPWPSPVILHSRDCDIRNGKQNQNATSQISLYTSGRAGFSSLKWWIWEFRRESLLKIISPSPAPPSMHFMPSCTHLAVFVCAARPGPHALRQHQASTGIKIPSTPRCS